jgi:hypothetical protein
MAASAKKGAKAGSQKSREITFKCQRCEKLKPIQEMTSITRFRPVLIVCQDCAKELR